MAVTRTSKLVTHQEHLLTTEIFQKFTHLLEGLTVDIIVVFEFPPSESWKLQHKNYVAESVTGASHNLKR